MAEAENPEEKVDLKSMMKKLSAGASYRRMMAAHEAESVMPTMRWVNIGFT